MHRTVIFLSAIALTIAAAMSYLAASFVADLVENRTARDVSQALNGAGLNWASVRTDGMIVSISGLAPDEANRFESMRVVSKVVATRRIHDDITVVNALAGTSPVFTLELLRNGDGISLIGLVPEETGRDQILESIKEINVDTEVTDMLESVAHPVPKGWANALNFGLASLRNLPRSKISVTRRQVTITAITNSIDEKNIVENALSRMKPDGVILVMKISAPRPVVSPFSLRLIIDEAEPRFDSCTADTKKARDRIADAAVAAGIKGHVSCAIGLGVPSPRWADAIEVSIAALVELKEGSLTVSDADITLVSTPEISQQEFDRIIHNLEQKLPDVFSLHAVLPPKPIVEGEVAEVEVPELLATKSPEGQVQIRGRLRDERTRVSVSNFARALFGSENVYNTARVDPGVPDGWPTRVLAGLEALSFLRNGALAVRPDMVEVRGTSIVPEARSEISRILSVKLGDSADFRILVTYEESLNQKVVLPTPQECVDRINDILKEQQITFAPSSVKIETASLNIVEKIAAAMTDCSEVPMEIGGHTDSQGSEKLNQTISQARAESVLDYLLSLEVLTTFLSAKGYGETQPIADNTTEEGRKANRRIAFTLIEPSQSPDPQVTGSQDQSTETENPDE